MVVKPNGFLDDIDTLSDQYNTSNLPPRVATAYFTKALIEIGFKLYIAGVPQVETWFPYNSAEPDKEKRKKLESEALAKATKFAQEHNHTKAPQLAIQITILKAHVQNGAADRWGADQYKVVPVWKHAVDPTTKEVTRPTDYSDVLKPTFDRLNINRWGEFYLKIILVPNVMGKLEDWTHDVDGDEDDPANPGHKKKVSKTDKVPTKVWVPDAVYPTEALMIAAAKEHAQTVAAASNSNGSNGNGASAPVQEEERPEGYTVELWAEYRPQIVADLATMTVQATANKYGIPVPFVMKFKLANKIEGPAV